MIEIRPIEDGHVIDLGKVELREYHANFEVYDDDIGIEPFELFDKETGRQINDNIYIGYNKPRDISGFIVLRDIQDNYNLMTEDGKYVCSIYPEESERLRLFIARVARNPELLKHIQCHDFFANKQIKKELFGMHDFLSKKRIEKQLKENSKDVGAVRVMCELEDASMRETYRLHERKIFYRERIEKIVQYRNKSYQTKEECKVK